MTSAEAAISREEAMDGLAIHLSRDRERLAVGGNTPFLLDDEESVFLVHKGKIDIFFVPLKEKEKPGARTFLCRIEDGQVAFCLGGSDGEPTVGFMAVAGQGTELIKIPISAVQKAAVLEDYAAVACRWIEAWITALSASISREELAPKVYLDPQPGKEVDLEDGHFVHVKGGLLWLTQRDGRSLFLGRQDLPHIEPGHSVPVCPHCWVMSHGTGRVEGASTADLLCRGQVLWKHLETFHTFVVHHVQLQSLRADKSDAENLAARRLADKRFAEGAYGRLSAVLRKDTKDFTSPSDDPLLSSCRLVGKDMGIEIVAPQRSFAGTNGEDPLQTIARASRFRAREILLRQDWWRQDNGPLLGYLEEQDRPVALLQIKPARYVMIDPAEGTRTPVDAGVADRLKPHGRVFYRSFPEEALTGKDLLKFGLKAVKKDVRRILLMGLLGGLVSLLIPIVTGFLYDTVIPSQDRPQLIQVVAALIVGALVSAAFLIVQAMAQLRIDARMGAQIQAALWDRLVALPPTFFRRYSAGDLVNRALGMTQIQKLLSGATVTTLVSSIFCLFNIAAMFWYSWRLALAGLALIIVAVIFAIVSFRLQMKYQRPLQKVMGEIQGLVLQLINGVAKLRIGGAEHRAFYLWASRFAQQKDLDVKTRRVTNAVTVFGSVLTLLGTLLIFAWVGLSAGAALLTLATGSFLAFYCAFTTVLTSIGHSLTVLFPALAVVPLFERTKPILSAVPEVNKGKEAPSELSGHIEISHVSFRYQSDGPLILGDVSLEVCPGEFVALVGPSGSGKSTIYRLLMGFESPETGSIYYDGNDLAGLDIREVRRQMGVVIQNGKLLTGSIYTNIVGSSGLTLEDAWDAARLCALDEDIKAMPMGMHTVLGEGGAGLSGGQQQRILIARAIVRRPRILLFDEATSALDNQAQAVVSQSLERLQATRIVIAHRLSTIREADRIYVLVDGEIVEIGKYEDLLALNGVFARLARRQMI